MEPEGIESERTRTEMGRPIIPSNDGQNDRQRLKESNIFDSDSRRAPAEFHVQFVEKSGVASDRANRALAGIAERTSAEDSLAQPSADAAWDSEMKGQLELHHLQQDTEKRAKDADHRGTDSPATERAITVERSMTDVENTLEEGTLQLKD